MRKLVMTILALVAAASAVELYWDDDTDGGSYQFAYMAVLFDDCLGPGDTGGRPGTISQMRFGVSDLDGSWATIYIYDVQDGEPGDPLLGPIHGGLQDPPEGYWYTWIPDDGPVEVPGEFFVVLVPGSGEYDACSLMQDTTRDWPVKHSRYYLDGEWHDRQSDWLVRVEWEPDAGIEEMSWGVIKARF
ncbi:MAG: hypothetical protein NTW26_08635 [bacterium]|nr:hypothetical protein [bacterium]